MSESLRRDQEKLARTEAEEQAERDRAARARRAEAELAAKRAIFEDALAGIGITKGPRGRPGVLEQALRLYVKHCEAHMGRLMGGGALGAQLYRNTPADPSLTPQLAVRARQAALDALFLLDAAELKRHLEADFTEASTHHKLVTAHEKRCTHTHLETGASAWQGWIFPPVSLDVPGKRGMCCTICRVTREETPAEQYTRTVGRQGMPCQHRYVAFNLTFDGASGPAGRSSMRCADCGAVQPTPPSTATELAHRDLEMRLRGEWPVAYRGIDGSSLTREEWLAGQESSNADPVDATDMGKAPPAD